MKGSPGAIHGSGGWSGGVSLFPGITSYWLDGNQKSGINSPVEVGYPMICKVFFTSKRWLFRISSINSTIPIRSRLDSVHHNSSNKIKSRPKILWAGTCHFTCTLPLTGGKTVPTLKKKLIPSTHNESRSNIKSRCHMLSNLYKQPAHILDGSVVVEEIC